VSLCKATRETCVGMRTTRVARTYIMILVKHSECFFQVFNLFIGVDRHGCFFERLTRGAVEKVVEMERVLFATIVALRAAVLMAAENDFRRTQRTQNVIIDSFW